MPETYLKQLGHAAVKGFATGLGLGVGVYGLMILSFWMGWLDKVVCK